MKDKDTGGTSRFEKISIKGFRRLADVEIELRPLSVLIGANGIGKTSLLDAFSMLASSAQGGLNSAISEYSGLSALLTYDRAEALELGLSLRQPIALYVDHSPARVMRLSMGYPMHETLNYLLRVKPQGTAYVIEEETLSKTGQPGEVLSRYIHSHDADVKYYEVGQAKLVRPNWEHNPLETSLSQVPKMFREPEDFRRRLSSSTFYHALNVEPRSPVRLPQPMRPATLPGRNGEDLISCLYSLRETERDSFDAVEDAMRAAFPGFDRLDFPPVAAGTLAMMWRTTWFSKPLYTHQLSEGMLRFLWLATLLQSPGLTTVTLLDEPEVSLHPELLNLLAGLLREASKRTQLIVATHSDRLVRFLNPSEVIVLDTTEDGMAQFTWADKLDLESWLAEYSLDEVWRMGLIGGRS